MKVMDFNPATPTEPLGPLLFFGASLHHIQDAISKQLPVPVPVNQRALLSNIAAFVTFLCIHNIEALKQA